MALHVLVLLLLFLLKLTVPAEQEEGGVPVMLGNTELAAGDADPYTMTEVDVMPSEAPSSAPEAAAEPEVEQPMITQQDEPSLQVKKEKPKTETKKEQPKKTPVKTETQKVNKPKEKTEAENGQKQKKRLLRLRPMPLPGLLEKVLRWEAREMPPEPDCRVVLRATLLLENEWCRWLWHIRLERTNFGRWKASCTRLQCAG